MGRGRAIGRQGWTQNARFGGRAGRGQNRFNRVKEKLVLDIGLMDLGKSVFDG